MILLILLGLILGGFLFILFLLGCASGAPVSNNESDIPNPYDDDPSDLKEEDPELYLEIYGDEEY